MSLKTISRLACARGLLLLHAVSPGRKPFLVRVVEQTRALYSKIRKDTRFNKKRYVLIYFGEPGMVATWATRTGSDVQITLALSTCSFSGSIYQDVVVLCSPCFCSKQLLAHSKHNFCLHLEHEVRSTAKSTLFNGKLKIVAHSCGFSQHFSQGVVSFGSKFISLE